MAPHFIPLDQYRRSLGGSYLGRLLDRLMDNLEDSVRTIEFDHSVNRIVWKNARGKIVGFEPGPPLGPKESPMEKDETMPEYAHDSSTFFDDVSQSLKRGHPVGKDLRRAINFGKMEIVHHGGLMKMRDPEDGSVLVEQRYLFQYRDKDDYKNVTVAFGPLETDLEELYKQGWRLRAYASRNKLRYGRHVSIRLMKPGSRREPGYSFRIGKIPAEKLMDHHTINLLPFLPKNINVINRVQHEVVESMTTDTMLRRHEWERERRRREQEVADARQERLANFAKQHPEYAKEEERLANGHRLDPRSDNGEFPSSESIEPKPEIDHRIYESCGNATFLETIRMALPQSKYLKSRRSHPLQ